jgi:signal transduction histidine kinase
MVYLVVLAILATSVAISSLFLVLPASVVDDYSIHRPYEIPPLILFLVALFYFYRNGLYKRNDAFYKGILGYLIVDIFSQIIMSYSATSFDTAHNVAHVLKDAGYFINIIALALSSIQYNERLKESNDRLKEREELIRVQFEKLKESDKMKDEFINVAAHELRTPLQPILGLTEVLRSKIKDAQQQELLDVVIRNAKRSQRLTNDILDVTKIESKSLNLNKEQFNLNDLIKNVIDDVIIGRDFKEDVKIRYEPKEDILVEGDRARITQVISNLLSNSIKFTTDGIITVIAKTSKDDDHEAAIISIKDTGTGIHPDILARLFTKFASKSFGGTGLGLFISKGIVEAHGGTIWAENNSDGRGATFIFTIPIVDKRNY